VTQQQSAVPPDVIASVSVPVTSTQPGGQNDSVIDIASSGEPSTGTDPTVSTVQSSTTT
jgi:hypothetical protein